MPLLKRKNGIKQAKELFLGKDEVIGSNPIRS
jgi:hypothetical protein